MIVVTHGRASQQSIIQSAAFKKCIPFFSFQTFLASCFSFPSTLFSMVLLKVCCAILIKEGKVLAVQRAEHMSQPLKWEFPGGKLNPNESEKECIEREIAEELGLQIEAKQKLASNIHRYSKELQIELIPFVCTLKGGKLQRTEHRDHRWLSLDELPKLNWSEADIPIVNALESKPDYS